MYTWMRDRPSDSTRKFALPKLRIPRMRPLVVVSMRSASSSGPVFSPCARDQVADGGRAIESMRIGIDAELGQLREVRAALLDLFVFR